MQVGLQLAIASAQAVDGVEDALVNLAVPFKVVDDATFEVVGAFSSLGAAKNYADERRSDMGKQWSKREAQILAVVDSTAGMVGDLQGKAMPEIPSLDMPLLEASTGPEAKHRDLLSRTVKHGIGGAAIRKLRT